MPTPYEVSYTLGHVHKTTVGVLAEDGEAALRMAKTAFDAGRLWDDSPQMPLLYDDFEEDDGQALAWECLAVSTFRTKDASVRSLNTRTLALQACRAMVSAYAQGGEGGSVGWEDLDHVHALACEALALMEEPASPPASGLPSKPLPRLAVMVEGGIVQAVVSDSALALDVAVVDYDAEGGGEIIAVPQADGGVAEAVVSFCQVELAGIDLDAVFAGSLP
jgi:hypothetical protein